MAHGGHSIARADILWRFPSSLRYPFNDFSPRVDHCTCFMNLGPSPVLVFEQDGVQRTVVHPGWCQQLIEEAKP